MSCRKICLFQLWSQAFLHAGLCSFKNINVVMILIFIGCCLMWCTVTTIKTAVRTQLLLFCFVYCSACHPHTVCYPCSISITEVVYLLKKKTVYPLYSSFLNIICLNLYTERGSGWGLRHKWGFCSFQQNIYTSSAAKERTWKVVPWLCLQGSHLEFAWQSFVASLNAIPSNQGECLQSSNLMFK